MFTAREQEALDGRRDPSHVVSVFYFANGPVFCQSFLLDSTLWNMKR